MVFQRLHEKAMLLDRILNLRFEKVISSVHLVLRVYKRLYKRVGCCSQRMARATRGGDRRTAAEARTVETFPQSGLALKHAKR
jgi:hypothetical protein